MAETVADFIVKLGYQVDKAQEQRFNSALDNLGKTFAWLAAGLTAAAATIQATVVSVSKSFDNLYFAAQRTNSTVSGIKALSYAFSQIGSSGGEAQAALEGLSKALRTNPGTAKWLNAQGIATEGRKTEEILSDIFEKFGKMPQYLGYQFAEMVGVSEETFNKAAKQWPQVIQWAKEFQATQARFGVDPDKAAESSNKLMTSFRALQMSLDALLTKVTVALQPQLNALMDDIAKWFEEHQEQIVKILNQVMEAVKALIADFGALLEALQPVADKFAEMVELLTGEKNSLKAALELLIGVTLVAFIAKWMDFLKYLALNPTFAALAMIAATGGLIYKGFTATDDEWAEAGRLASGTNSDGIKGLEGAAGQQSWFTRNIINPIRGVFGAGKVDDIGKPISGDAPRPGLTKITTKSGKTAWVPTEGAAQFQGFLNDYEAAGGKIDDLQGFSDRDVRGHPGVKSAHGQEGAIDINPLPSNPFDVTRPMRPQTGELAKKWSLGWGGDWTSRKDWGHLSLRKKEGGRLLSPDELKALQDDQAARLKDKQSELFGAPALGASSARLASINNRTSITVYGSSDPAGTAANLNGAQSRVASELIRNGQSAFV